MASALGESPCRQRVSTASASVVPSAAATIPFGQAEGLGGGPRRVAVDRAGLLARHQGRRPRI